MQAYTQEQLNVFYDATPQALKDALWDKKTTDVLLKIARKYSLASKQKLLGKITGRILMGVLPIQKFLRAIQEELELPEDQSRAIADEIREKIFAPVVDELRKLHGLDAT